jgi:SAM-dependent methyltransferase
MSQFPHRLASWLGRARFWIIRRLPAPARRALWDFRGRKRSPFVDGYLGGLSGLEIGGSAHNDFGLDALNVDRYESLDTVYKREEWALCGSMRPVDVVAPGDELPFEDDSVDFVFSSHVIEHFPDPIRALEEWRRVARRYVLVIAPHRDRTFDKDRDLTPMTELEERRRDSFRTEEDSHWTVWTCESFLEMCDRFGFDVLDHQDPDDKVGNGFSVLIDAAGVPAENPDGSGSSAPATRG